jgi:hypothetical protein
LTRSDKKPGKFDQFDVKDANSYLDTLGYSPEEIHNLISEAKKYHQNKVDAKKSHKSKEETNKQETYILKEESYILVRKGLLNYLH